ncbi:two-partner secretion domain-containing protein [Allocoleopsis franciscana]|uniref:Filamentous hemagglutinin family N-terminal domain protein n=1 Tax=Allocoleopsis franciscana PCC 7113 TaxID=1173027 RepID=K9WEZ5_9CYAN|nr:filamentous hemagglutinin N-terminal domain-containing protein [Allocoleopsis franciscana]AFZ18067.1 filamentous hemagglutinin family N-terminal domain protein [Allocoleopsis franciscana PCC 7113]
MKRCINPYWIAAGISLCYLATTTPVVAQITSDGTLPTNVTRSGNIWEITGGTQAGGNLFHSFSQFSVPTGNAAYFNNAPLIENIFSRVTGSSASEIDGLIRTNGTANLFLLNPNGILFGSNARLDIGGSFTASTSDRIVFADGTQFKATDTASQPLLTISTPLGVQYGTQPSGTINNAGNLAVKSNANITLFGTTVTNTGQLVAPGGTVQVLGDRIALLDNALIDVSAVGGGGTVLIGGDYQGKGTVPNASRSFVSKDVTINADALDNGNGGKVIIWSDESTRFYGNIRVRGGKDGGNGGFVEVSGGQFLDFQGNVNTSAPKGSFGTLLLDPTDIEIVATGGNTTSTNLLFTDPPFPLAQIDASVINNALANVVLQATNNITFSTGINIAAPGVGLTAQAGNNITVALPVGNSFETKGGDMRFIAGNNIVVNTFVSNWISPHGGNIQLIAGAGNGATGSITVDGNLLSFPGNTGNISLAARGDISITGRSQIRSNLGDISFNAGGNLFITGISSVDSTRDLFITAAGTILIDNSKVSADRVSPNSIGGNVNVDAARLRLLNGGQLTADGIFDGNGGIVTIRVPEIEMDSTGIYGNSQISASAIRSLGSIPRGNAGKIEIQTGRLTARNGAQIIAATYGSGNAGEVTVRANEIELIGVAFGDKEASGFFANNQPGSTGGNGRIAINTGRLLARDGAGVFVASFNNQTSGEIRIQASDIALIGNAPSYGCYGSYGCGGLLARALEGTGNAGAIAIDTNRLLVQDGALIDVRAATGNGGNLNIRATDSMIVSDRGIVSAVSTGIGAGGNIAINTKNLTVQNNSIVGTGSNNQDNAGSITVRNSESVTVSNRSVISSLFYGSGAGANLDIETGNLTISDGSGVLTSSAGQGNAGNLNVRAANSVNVINNGILSTGTLGTGAGGNLAIETKNLNILTSGKVFTSSLDASTFDFSILDPNIYSPASVELIRNSVNAAAQGNFTQGNSGNLTVTATDSVNVATNGLLSTQAYGKASAGNLAVTTGQLTLQDAGTISTTSFGEGFGGNIQLQANSLSLNNDGRISSRSQGANRAGNISINVRDNLQSSRGDILATSVQSGGGDININARDVRLRNSSLISSSVFNSTGGGGNITINSETFLALEDSDILANADAGPGGNIRIISPAFLVDLFENNRAVAVGRNPGDLSRFRGNSRVDISDNFGRLPNNQSDIISNAFSSLFDNDRTDISAASQSGSSGTVTIPPIEPFRRLAPLPAGLVDASDQINQNCSPRRAGDRAQNRFIITGRGGLPPSPNDVLQGDSVTTDWVTLDSQEEQFKDTTSGDRTTEDSARLTYPPTPVTIAAPTKHELVEAQGWVYGSKGEVILTASASTVTHRSPFITPLSCEDIKN